MTGKEALEELKNVDLYTYDDEGNIEDSIKLGEYVEEYIEPIEKELKAFSIFIKMCDKDLLKIKYEDLHQNDKHQISKEEWEYFKEVVKEVLNGQSKKHQTRKDQKRNCT